MVSNGMVHSKLICTQEMVFSCLFRTACLVERKNEHSAIMGCLISHVNGTFDSGINAVSTLEKYLSVYATFATAWWVCSRTHTHTYVHKGVTPVESLARTKPWKTHLWDCGKSLKGEIVGEIFAVGDKSANSVQIVKSWSQHSFLKFLSSC